MGRCLECGSWGTLKEISQPKAGRPWADNFQYLGSARDKFPISKQERQADKGTSKEVTRLGGSRIKVQRYPVGYQEFDRVLGGGLVKGSLVMLGGDPGVGKSTLALQAAARLSVKNKCLYVSAEESLEQTSQRAERLVEPADKLDFIHETNIENIIATVKQEKSEIAVIDSIQTVYTEELSSESGSLNQVRACTVKLLEACKEFGLTVIIIGQVTKKGTLAGPKASEHLVDAVLYLEGDKYKQYRLLRAAKNRFGSLDEVGIWQMAKEGLKEVLNPSEVFLAGYSAKSSGSVITAVAEGSRVFLVEVQALVAKSNTSYPKRTTSGFEAKRLEILTTVLSKRAGINLANFDVVVNIAGGLSLKEPSLDLAVAAAISSAWADKPLPDKTVVFGEVGLAGELRTVLKTKERVKEAIKLGFKKIILPYFDGEVKGVELIKIKEVRDIIKLLK
jgi:DNA repair protein RadA/Sms